MTKMQIKPLRGDIWFVDLDPVVGHEQGKRRPCLVVSTNSFNTGYAGLVTLVPLTSVDKKIPWHVKITSPEGGVIKVSFALCEQVSTVSKDRFSGKPLGTVDDLTLHEVENRLRVLLEL